MPMYPLQLLPTVPVCCVFHSLLQKYRFLGVFRNAYFTATCKLYSFRPRYSK